MDPATSPAEPLDPVAAGATPGTSAGAGPADAAPTDVISTEQYALLLAGDEQAWYRLIREHEGRIYGYLYRLEGNSDAALDLTQEVFYRAWRFFGTFRAGERLLPWLYTVARNTQAESHRRKQHARFSLEQAHEDSGFEVPSEARSPVSAAENRDTQDRVQRALMTLPGDYREAVVLRFMDDLSYADIARIQGVALGTAKSRVHRAKEQLAGALRAQKTEPGPTVAADPTTTDPATQDPARKGPVTEPMV